MRPPRRGPLSLGPASRCLWSGALRSRRWPAAAAAAAGARRSPTAALDMPPPRWRARTQAAPSPPRTPAAPQPPPPACGAPQERVRRSHPRCRTPRPAGWRLFSGMGGRSDVGHRRPARRGPTPSRPPSRPDRLLAAHRPRRRAAAARRARWRWPCVLSSGVGCGFRGVLCCERDEDTPPGGQGASSYGVAERAARVKRGAGASRAQGGPRRGGRPRHHPSPRGKGGGDAGVAAWRTCAAGRRPGRTRPTPYQPETVNPLTSRPPGGGTPARAPARTPAVRRQEPAGHSSGGRGAAADGWSPQCGPDHAPPRPSPLPPRLAARGFGFAAFLFPRAPPPLRSSPPLPAPPDHHARG
jgi:hypothetical protein